MRRVPVIVCLVLLFFSCTSKRKTDTNNNVNELLSERYPPQIDSLKIGNLYDSAKWALYCIYADDTCKFASSTGKDTVVMYGELELKFESLKQFNDTTEMQFYFYYDSIRCDGGNVRNAPSSGVAFVGNDSHIRYYTSNTTISRFWNTDPRSRFVNHLQPDVINYIKSNKSKLHPWFINQAKLKKII